MNPSVLSGWHNTEFRESASLRRIFTAYKTLILRRIWDSGSHTIKYWNLNFIGPVMTYLNVLHVRKCKCTALTKRDSREHLARWMLVADEVSSQKAMAACSDVGGRSARRLQLCEHEQPRTFGVVRSSDETLEIPSDIYGCTLSVCFKSCSAYNGKYSTLRELLYQLFSPRISNPEIPALRNSPRQDVQPSHVINQMAGETYQSRFSAWRQARGCRFRCYR